MNVYKVFLNEMASDKEFPNLKRFPRQEIVEENCENAHVSLVKYRLSSKEENVVYCIGK